MKTFLISLVFSICTAGVNAQLAAEEAISAIEGTKQQPSLQSILNNSNVNKKSKRRGKVEATGFHDAGSKNFIIHFRKKQLHGEWQTFYFNKQACDSGSFVKNLPGGEWKTWYGNGRLKTIRNYSERKFRYIMADIRRHHPKDFRYQLTRYLRVNAEFKNLLLPAFEYKGPSADLNLFQKIKLNAGLHERDYIPPFKECLHHGAFINYYENGSVKDSGYFFNGLRHDVWKETDEITQHRAFGYYHYGVKQGQWKYYALNGALLYTEMYRQGKKTEIHYFNN